MTAPQPLPPLKLTTARWRNRKRLARAVNGEQYERWAKVLSHTGTYEQFAYDTDTASDKPGPLQRCIICSPWSGVIAIDVDDEAAYVATRTAQIARREHALSRRGAGFHVLVDCRSVPQQHWPGQGPIVGGDIKSCGFIPVPGSEHYSGDLYEPVLRDGRWAHVVTATPGLMEAMAADLDDERERRRAQGGSQGGGAGGGHDGEIAAEVLRMALRGLTKEQCHAEWVRIAIPRDPADPFTRHDFERHWSRVPAKVAAQAEFDRQCWLAALPWLRTLELPPASKHRERRARRPGVRA